MYALIASGAVGVTLVIAALIGYTVRQRTRWDIRWGRYRDTQMTITDQTIDEIAQQMNLYREIDHPLVSALTPIIEEHNARLAQVKPPKPTR